MKQFLFYLLCSIAFTESIRAQEYLDASFGGTGKVTHPYGMFDTKIAVQPDQKIVVAGEYSNLVMMRFNPDGSLDTQFGNGGLAIVTPFIGVSLVFKSLIALPDGKLLLSGSMGEIYQKLFVVRMNYDGSVDSTFATNGLLINDPSPTDCSNLHGWDYSGGHIAVSSDGRIVQVGTQREICQQQDYFHWVGRYLPDGTIDTTFSFVNFGISQYLPNLGGVMIDEDSSIIAYGSGLGWFEDSLLSVPKYQRTEPDGSTTIGSGGGVLPAPSRNHVAFETTFMKRHKDGCIIGGHITENGKNRMVVARVDSNYKSVYPSFGTGSIDSSFGTNGYSVIDFTNGGKVAEAEVLAGNKILLIGTSDEGGFSQADFTLVRLNEDGSRDATFGTNGVIRTDFNNGGEFVYHSAKQVDGKIVVAGATYSGTTRDALGLVRYGYTPTGISALDNSNIRLYPNPFSDALNFETGQPAFVTITNIQGQVLFEKMINTNCQIPTDQLLAGMYILNVTLVGQVTTSKIIKQ
jgi:uncharacterized delta-60 repeat protein